MYVTLPKATLFERDNITYMNVKPDDVLSNNLNSTFLIKKWPPIYFTLFK
jgi:hypothetical protein